jgi:beta-phosphoglucomutase-like phosphatase (HAD superfamily)
MRVSERAMVGLGRISPEWAGDMVELTITQDGLWRVGRDGVERILTPRDRKVEFLVFADKTLANVRSALGPGALYPLLDAQYAGRASAVLMDLDGTSVHSERFWTWMIERTVAALLDKPGFTLEAADEPMVSGHSVSEHLQYCIDKYCPGRSLEEARQHYFRITRREMEEIARGRGRCEAFDPSPGLKDFLLALKGAGVKIGLVTSGLFEKAWPEILSAFRTLGLGDPREFYDAIITAGDRLTPGQTGTLGELAPKPHPWLYAETAYVGLGVRREERAAVVGIEDSGAGVVSIRLAGFAAIGVRGGNIEASGVRPLLHAYRDSLLDTLPIILGR